MPNLFNRIMEAVFVLLAASFAIHLAADWLASATPVLVVLIVLAVLVVIYRLLWQRWR